MYNKNLKFLRERLGLTQQEMGKMIDVVKSQYCLYETEKVTIPIKHLNTLCNYFDVSLDYIFEFTDIKRYKNSKNEIDKKLSGERIKSFRKENKITQTKLSTILNTSFSNISSYERGVNIISTSFLYAICTKYNISADYLLGKIDEPKNFR